MVEKLELKTKVLILVVLAVLGLALFAWITQLVNGLGVTGMNKPVFWGIYIVNFAFFIGISAGGIAVASLCHLAGIEKYKPIGRITEIIAIVSLMLAIASILVDLGRPERLLNFFIHPQLNSPLIWDFAVVGLYLFLCLFLLWTDIKGKHKLTKIFAYVSIPVFVLVHSITAWVFGLIKAQPSWHTTILAPLFIISALVSGLGLVILALLFARKFLNFKIDDDIVISLGKYFKVTLPALFYFLFSEMITGIFPRVPHELAIFNEMFTGRFAFVFWIDIVIGIVLPFILILTPVGKTITGMGVISLMCFAGVFAERVNIILPSFFHPLLPYSPSYSPTWVEWSIAAGIYSFGILLFIIALRVVPLWQVQPFLKHVRESRLEG